jgi:hypothetical protein
VSDDLEKNVNWFLRHSKKKKRMIFFCTAKKKEVQIVGEPDENLKKQKQSLKRKKHL